MTDKELARLVAAMRAAQVRYFRKGRTDADLRASKALEKEVDAAVREVLSGALQGELFGGGTGP